MPHQKRLDHPRLSSDADVCRAHSADTSGLVALPAAVVRPETTAEVADILRQCAEHHLGVTAQGLRSSTTGASVPYGCAAHGAIPREGVVLSLERMNRILEIDPVCRRAMVQPGVVTADLKSAVEAAGLFYPPDPTSEEESTLGGNVACNASGSRSYRYGVTRRYVRSLEIVLSTGEIIAADRIDADKNAAGYAGFQNPIDLWIGSEGTLGVVTRIELDLLPRPAGFFGALAFFPTWREAISFVQSADQASRAGRLRARCFEFFGSRALGILQGQETPLGVPDDAGAAIYFEEELPGDHLDRWAALIEGHGGRVESTIFAETAAQQRELRRLRHTIPATMNERGQTLIERGGRRVSTDFAVPLAKLPQLMETCFGLMDERFGGFTVAYGHVGNGHPHFNLLAEDPESLARAHDTVREMVRAALALGGVLSAEHGIGKVKVPYFHELYPHWIRTGMQAVKRCLDPAGILAPGNLFS